MAPDYTPVIDAGRRVVEMESRYAASVRDGRPEPGSTAARLLGDQLGAMAFHHAAMALACAFDHLRTVAQVVATGRIPAMALTSVIRSAHEAALIAQWLLDPSVDNDERIRRGVRAQYNDLDERRKFEAVIQREPPKTGKLAVDRLDDLMALADVRGMAKPGKSGKLVPVVDMPSTVELFDKYETNTGCDGSWLYRYYSGFAHGKQWAVMFGIERVGGHDANGHGVGRIEANDAALVRIMQLATEAVARAFGWFEQLRSG